jgi:hypothetical protein
MRTGELESALKRLLGDAYIDQALVHIGAALQLAGVLEQKGYEFKLADARPKSPDQNLWRAMFAKEGKTFTIEDEDAPLAVCRCVLEALSGE